jgi:NADH:ubiquinone oxidoreductase subunit 2 (subunit N)
VMYMREPGESVEKLPPAGALLQIAVYGSAVGTVLLGVFPSLVLDFANRAALR